MVANECEYCHESLCIGKCILGESFECKGMVKKDIVIECHAENSDLVDGFFLVNDNYDKFMTKMRTKFSKELEKNFDLFDCIESMGKDFVVFGNDLVSDNLLGHLHSSDKKKCHSLIWIVSL